MFIIRCDKCLCERGFRCDEQQRLVFYMIFPSCVMDLWLDSKWLKSICTTPCCVLWGWKRTFGEMVALLTQSVPFSLSTGKKYVFRAMLVVVEDILTFIRYHWWYRTQLPPTRSTRWKFHHCFRPTFHLVCVHWHPNRRPWGLWEPLRTRHQSTLDHYRANYSTNCGGSTADSRNRHAGPGASFQVLLKMTDLGTTSHQRRWNANRSVFKEKPWSLGTASKSQRQHWFFWISFLEILPMFKHALTGVAHIHKYTFKPKNNIFAASFQGQTWGKHLLQYLPVFFPFLFNIDHSFLVSAVWEYIKGTVTAICLK